jgi:hypothetical protein
MTEYGCAARRLLRWAHARPAKRSGILAAIYVVISQKEAHPNKSHSRPNGRAEPLRACRDTEAAVSRLAPLTVPLSAEMGQFETGS